MIDDILKRQTSLIKLFLLAVEKKKKKNRETKLQLKSPLEGEIKRSPKAQRIK